MSGTKYDQLLDAEVQAFIARTASCYPERSAPPDLQQMRSDYEQTVSYTHLTLPTKA